MACVKILRGNDLLFESWANSEGNITSLVSAIKTVQKESNVFLSKLVEEEKSVSGNSNSKPSDGRDNDEEDDIDDDESEDDGNQSSGDQIVSTKRLKRNEALFHKDKKFCAEK